MKSRESWWNDEEANEMEWRDTNDAKMTRPNGRKIKEGEEGMRMAGK